MSVPINLGEADSLSQYFNVAESLSANEGRATWFPGSKDTRVFWHGDSDRVFSGYLSLAVLPDTPFGVREGGLTTWHDGSIERRENRSMNHKLSRLYAQDIRQARVAKGWSRKRLAKEMRVPWILVQQWEEGSEPETRYALRLYVLLGVRVMPVVTIQPRAQRVQKVEEPTVPVISWTPTVGKF